LHFTSPTVHRHAPTRPETPTCDLLDKDLKMPTASSKKRKSDAQNAPESSKKARISENERSDTAQLVDNVLKSAKKGGDLATHTLDPVQKILMLANYARALELDLVDARASQATPSSPQEKTQAELEEAAEKIRRSAVSGICKQMTVDLTFTDLLG
jgi:hypothetical protein